MGIGSASRAQQQATQQAMIIQAVAAQQQADAQRAAEARARADQQAAQQQAQAALQQGQQQAVAAQQNLAQIQGRQALEEAQRRSEAALLQNQQAAREAIQSGTARSAQAITEGREGGVSSLGDYYRQGVGYQQPYMTAGSEATNRLAQLYGQGGEYTQQPTLDQLQMDPGYAFRLQQGQQALNATLGAGGLRGSGAALKAGTRYGQEAGSQEYQNAYARFMANRAAATQGLQNLSAGGLSAAGTATNLAGQTGVNTANLYNTAGQNLGSLYGTEGSNLANIYGTAGQNLASLYGGTGSNIANLLSGSANQLGNIYTGTGANLGQAALTTGQGLASNAMTTGQNLAAIQGGLGQALGQGYANIGNIQAQQAMAPVNMLASGLGQGAQLAAMAYGGGLGLNPAARASSYSSSGGMRFPIANAGGGFSPTGWG